MERRWLRPPASAVGLQGPEQGLAPGPSLCLHGAVWDVESRGWACPPPEVAWGLCGDGRSSSSAHWAALISKPAANVAPTCLQSSSATAMVGTGRVTRPPPLMLHVGCQVFCKIKCIPPRLVSWELSRAHRIRNCIAFTLCKSHCVRPFGPWLAGKRNQLEACCSPCPNINWKKKIKMFSSNLRDISLRLNLRAGGQISISEISNTLSFCQNTAPLKNT